jgi:hypothetical protein
MKESVDKKILQAVNLSPDENIIEKLAEMHPMRQITYASVIQVTVLFSMFGCFAINEQIITHLL